MLFSGKRLYGEARRRMPPWRDLCGPHHCGAEEQQSQTAFSAKTLRAAALLPVAFVGSVLIPTRRDGDARTSPPRPPPKSLAAAPSRIFRQALSFLQIGKDAVAPAWRDKPYAGFSIDP